MTYSNNPSVRLVPFHWAHPLSMDLREHDKAHFRNMPDYIERLKAFQEMKTAYTAVCGKNMACCFGVTSLWVGVAEAWMLTTYHVERNPISLTRGAMRYFNQVAIDMQLHRLQITVDNSNVLALRWANALQFKQEGVLRGYGPNKSDHTMFARLY